MGWPLAYICIGTNCLRRGEVQPRDWDGGGGGGWGSMYFIMTDNIGACLVFVVGFAFSIAIVLYGINIYVIPPGHPPGDVVDVIDVVHGLRRRRKKSSFKHVIDRIVEGLKTKEVLCLLGLFFLFGVVGVAGVKLPCRLLSVAKLFCSTSYFYCFFLVWFRWRSGWLRWGA